MPWNHSCLGQPHLAREGVQVPHQAGHDRLEPRVGAFAWRAITASVRVSASRFRTIALLVVRWAGLSAAACDENVGGFEAGA